MVDRQKIVLFSLPRTGSALVTDLLNQFGIKMAAEIFNPKSQADRKEFESIFHQSYPLQFDDLFDLEKDLSGFLGLVFSVYDGLKIHKHQIHEQHSLLDLIEKDDSIKVIHLHRQNILKQAVSHEIAKQTNVWQFDSPDMEKMRFSGKIKLDEHDLKNRFETNDRLFHVYQDRFSFLKDRYLEIIYEDIESNLSNVVLKIAA